MLVFYFVLYLLIVVRVQLFVKNLNGESDGEGHDDADTNDELGWYGI